MRYDIIGGPNRDQLFEAAKLTYERGIRFSIKFDIVEGYSSPDLDDPTAMAFLLDVTDIMIVGIAHEDGSGHSFNVEGFCNVEGEHKKYIAYYDTESMGGNIIFK